MKPIIRVCSYAFLIFIFAACQRTSISPPPPDPPKDSEITTNMVTTIAADSAVGGGTITPNGDTSSVLESGICYDTQHAPDITKSKLIKTVSSGSFSCILTSLNSAITYYVRAYVIRATGIKYGNEVSFNSAKHPVAVGNHYFNGPVRTICSDPSGNIYAGGEFFGDYRDIVWEADYVAKYDGSSWNELTGMRSSAYIVALCSDPVGNIFSSARIINDVVYYAVRYHGSGWDTVGFYNSSNYNISGMCADASGNVYAIGTAQNASGKYYVAHWGSGGYEELGAFDAQPEGISIDASGNLYVAGLMNHGYNGNQGNFYIAKWNGAAWTELGTFNDAIFSLCVDNNNNLIAAGAFNLDGSGAIMSGGPFTNVGPSYYVAKWDGSSWSKLGDLSMNKNYGNYITRVCSDNSGNVYITGEFTDAAGRYYVAKWDGASWSEIASFNDRIYSICTDPSGNIYAAGKFTDRNGQWYVAKCN